MTLSTHITMSYHHRFPSLNILETGVIMDGRNKNRTDQPKKSKESAKPKNEPLTVKYISNPIKMSARSESEFRAIVQEYTGKDAGTSSPPGQGTQGMDSSNYYPG
ncbi:hypothetical protein Drorol1_Dr00024751 [Drosera rotundifolia]